MRARLVEGRGRRTVLKEVSNCLCLTVPLKSERKALVSKFHLFVIEYWLLRSEIPELTGCLLS